MKKCKYEIRIAIPMRFHNGSLRSQFVPQPIKYKQKHYKYEEFKINKHEEM